MYNYYKGVCVGINHEAARIFLADEGAKRGWGEPTDVWYPGLDIACARWGSRHCLAVSPRGMRQYAFGANPERWVLVQEEGC